MKKNSLNIQVLNRFRKKYIKIVFSVALIFTLIVAIPIISINAYAALLEDCDLDGYDDATGVPVPWPGYDETKGDTPSGPGGVITSTKAATSTTTTTATTAAKTAASTNNTASGSTSNTSTGSTNTSSGGTSTSSTSNTNTSSSGSSNSSSAVTESTVTPSTGTASTGTASTSNSGSGDSNAQSTVANGSSETVVASSTLVSGDDSSAPVSFDTIINTKGLLNIIDAKGSIIHAGSSVIISGSGFIGNINDLKIEIHSNPLQLGSVTSSKDGSFEVQINIPENLEIGTHNIVVLYQGIEIVSQQIEVAPKAADTFWEALTVGFSTDNKGLIPGLLVLAGLIIAGSVTLLIGGITNSRRSNRVSGKVV